MGGLAKLVGLVVVGLLIALGVAAAAIYGVSEMRLGQKVDAPAERILVPTDISDVQHGQHLASAIAMCVDCHASNLSGRVVVDDPSVARIVAPNLTRGSGGFGTRRTDADLARAIRQGVDPTGRQLLMMPSDDYNHFSDGDLASLVAYIRSLPPVDSTLPSNDVHLVGRALLVFGQLPLLPASNIDRTTPRPKAPGVDLTPEYGAYLAQTAGCIRCHGPGLAGGKMPDAPAGAVPAANITPAGLHDWSEADFLRLMRTGKRPDGRSIDPSMPWPYFAQMTELELRSVWRFLEAIPPRQTGTH
jgi:cytochrome c553